MYVLPFGQMSLWGGFCSLFRVTLFIFIFSFIFYSTTKYVMKSRLSSTISNLNNIPTRPGFFFMAMLVGLIDEDGYIVIDPQKQYSKTGNSQPKYTIIARLVLRLHTRDKELLLWLVKVWGVGMISELPNRNQVRLIFSKLDLVNVIIPLMNKFNLFFLTFNRRYLYSILLYIIINNIKHWENVNYIPSITLLSVQDFLNLSFF